MKKILLTVFAFCSTVIVSAQSLNHIGVFPTIDHSGTINNKLDYSFYYFAQLHAYNDEVNKQTEPTGLFVFYSEQALHYKLNKMLTLSGSYVYERQYPFENNYRNENRFYVQATYKYPLNKASIKHRLRFDGRFVQNRLTGETPFTHRIRYLAGVSLPVGKNDKCSFTAYNEFFFNTYKGATVKYAENWVAAAIGIKTGKNSSVEAGPLYIFWVNDNIGTLNNFYYLQVAWVSHINFNKRQL